MNASVTVEEANIFLEVTPNTTMPQSAITNLVSDLALKANISHPTFVSPILGSASATNLLVTNKLKVLSELEIDGQFTSTNARVASANVATHAGTASSINASLLTGTTIPSSIVSSSLTGLGTLTHLTVSGSISVDGGTLHVDPTNNRVGVGTTSPNQSLAVVGTASITSTTNVGGLLTSASIGIGTLTPASALHVVGGTNITGNASVGGNVFVVGTLNATSYGSSSAASAGTLYMSASATRVWGASARLTATSGSINGTTGTSIDFPSLLQSVEAGRKSVVVTQRNPDALPGFIFSTSPGTSNFVIKGINVVNTSYSGNVDVNIVAVSVE